MTSTIKDKPVKPEPLKFPVLMENVQNARGDIIVLFSDVCTGMVVYSSDPDYYVGEHRTMWTKHNNPTVWLPCNKEIILSN